MFRLASLSAVLLLSACASTMPPVPALRVQAMTKTELDLRGCGMTLTQPAGGTLFAASASGDARLKLNDRVVKLSRVSATGESLPGGQAAVQVFGGEDGVRVTVTARPGGAESGKSRRVNAGVEVETPTGLVLLDAAGEAGC